MDVSKVPKEIAPLPLHRGACLSIPGYLYMTLKICYRGCSDVWNVVCANAKSWETGQPRENPAFQHLPDFALYERRISSVKSRRGSPALIQFLKRYSNGWGFSHQSRTWILLLEETLEESNTLTALERGLPRLYFLYSLIGQYRNTVSWLHKTPTFDCGTEGNSKCQIFMSS